MPAQVLEVSHEDRETGWRSATRNGLPAGIDRAAGAGWERPPTGSGRASPNAGFGTVDRLIGEGSLPAPTLRPRAESGIRGRATETRGRQQVVRTTVTKNEVAEVLAEGGVDFRYPESGPDHGPGEGNSLASVGPVPRFGPRLPDARRCSPAGLRFPVERHAVVIVERQGVLLVAAVVPMAERADLARWRSSANGGPNAMAALDLPTGPRELLVRARKTTISPAQPG